MVEVLERKEGNHKVKCGSCGSVLQYHSGEVKTRNGRDYSGGSDGEDWVDCPVCGERAIIRSW